MNLLLECKGASKIAIGGHIHPDGDCVSSCLAMYQYLKKCLPDAYIKVFLEKPSDIFAELKGFEEIDSSFAEDTVFDVFFCLDCAAERLGEGRKYFDQAKKTVNIDHHISNTGCAMVNLVRPQVGSACEVIYDLMEKEWMDAELAKTLTKKHIENAKIHMMGCVKING